MHGGTEQSTGSEEEHMSIAKLNPYLLFNGTAEEATKLYASALGARILHLMHFGDVPGAKVSPQHAGRVMHALLHIGEGVVMVSDTSPERPVATEGNVQVCLHFGDAADMARRFDALAVGGRVAMPLHDAFWGARFGMLTDAFGIQWMFSCDPKQT